MEQLAIRLAHQKTMGKSLVIPQAGEEANEKGNLQSLREKVTLSRYASFNYRAMVLVRLILFCSWMMPYNSASAVGGQPGT